MNFLPKPLRLLVLPVAVGVGGLVLGACSRVEDRRERPGICELHKVKMQTEVVYPCKMQVNWKADYLRDKPRLFPHCTGYGPSWYDYEGQPFKVYVCSACVRAQEDYTKDCSAR